MDQCNFKSCGSNAQCYNGTCTCVPNFYGNAEIGCRPECVHNNDCNRSQACINNKCSNPCNNLCGVKAECYVINHLPICACPKGMTGDPFILCDILKGL